MNALRPGALRGEAPLGSAARSMWCDGSGLSGLGGSATSKVRKRRNVDTRPRVTSSTRKTRRNPWTKGRTPRASASPKLACPWSSRRGSSPSHRSARPRNFEARVAASASLRSDSSSALSSDSGILDFSMSVGPRAQGAAWVMRPCNWRRRFGSCVLSPASAFALRASSERCGGETERGKPLLMGVRLRPPGRSRREEGDQRDRD
jgi:hypothetical protein